MKQGAKYKKYFVELSLLKNKIIILLVDQKNKTRMFQLDQATEPSQLDGGTKTILLLQLWKKQIQYIFMEYYCQEKMNMLIAKQITKEEKKDEEVE